MMYNRLISYQNALLSLGSNVKLTSIEKSVVALGEEKKIIHQIFFCWGGGGGGGGVGMFGGGGGVRSFPPPPPPHPHWIYIEEFLPPSHDHLGR